jgi:hypothetical protein
MSLSNGQFAPLLPGMLHQLITYLEMSGPPVACAASMGAPVRLYPTSSWRRRFGFRRPTPACAASCR